jgi:hypothetical protein
MSRTERSHYPAALLGQRLLANFARYFLETFPTIVCAANDYLKRPSIQKSLHAWSSQHAPRSMERCGDGAVRAAGRQPQYISASRATALLTEILVRCAPAQRR